MGEISRRAAMLGAAAAVVTVGRSDPGSAAAGQVGGFRIERSEQPAFVFEIYGDRVFFWNYSGEEVGVTYAALRTVR